MAELIDNEWDGPTGVPSECAQGHLWVASGLVVDGVEDLSDSFGHLCPECGRVDVEVLAAVPSIVPCPDGDLGRLRGEYEKIGGVWKSHEVIELERWNRECEKLLDDCLKWHYTEDHEDLH